MSELSKLVAAGRSGVLDGYTLSPLTLYDFGECEREFENRRLVMAKIAAEGLPAEAAERIVQRAMDEIDRGKYSLGTRSFDEQALAAKHAPLLLYLSLRHKHPEVTREKANDILGQPREVGLHDAILDAAGYGGFKKKLSDPEPPVQSPGDGSSGSSENSSTAPSATTTSAA